MGIHDREIIGDKEFKNFCSLIYEQSGIRIEVNKKALVMTRLSKRIRAKNLGSYKEYYDFVTSDKTGAEMTAMLDAISTNLTFFYREIKHFDFMKNTMIPKIAKEQNHSSNVEVRVWCSASSSGEEPYSILFTLLEHPLFKRSWRVKMLATDISTEMLKIAQKGEYDEKRIESVPREILNKYFIKMQNGNSRVYQVEDQYRNLIKFKRFNLMTSNFPFKQKFDFIFCRNVMIYFDKPTREILVNKFYKYLKKDGYLIIGHSESLSGIKHDYAYSGPTIYQKIT